MREEESIAVMTKEIMDKFRSIVPINTLFVEFAIFDCLGRYAKKILTTGSMLNDNVNTE
jgi:hypothetical protein